MAISTSGNYHPVAQLNSVGLEKVASKDLLNRCRGRSLALLGIIVGVVSILVVGGVLVKTLVNQSATIERAISASTYKAPARGYMMTLNIVA
jgi:hypothetical protein